MLHPSKCDHGVYWPCTDKINPFCQFCNPKYGLRATDSPKKPRKRKNTDNGLPESPFAGDSSPATI